MSIQMSIARVHFFGKRPRLGTTAVAVLYDRVHSTVEAGFRGDSGDHGETIHNSMVICHRFVGDGPHHPPILPSGKD